MNFKRLLKSLSLVVACAGAGLWAYADGPIKLIGGDGKTYSWSEYVALLNSTVDVDEDQIPAAIKTALANAKAEAKTAQETYDDADKQQRAAAQAVTDADTKVGQKETALTTAKTTQGTKLTTYNEAKGAYNSAEAQLADWKNELSNQQTLYNKTSGQISSKASEITGYTSNPENITTVTSYPEWATRSNDAANDFFDQWIDYYDNPENTGLPSDKPIYVKSSGNNLNVSFNSSTLSEGYTSTTVAAFSDFITENDKKFRTIYLTYGSDSNTAQTRITFNTSGLTTSQLGDAAFTCVEKMNSIYDGSKETKQVNKYQSEINQLNRDIESLRADLSKYEGEIDRLQGLINGYTLVPEGSADGTVSEQKRLENAKNTAESEYNQAVEDVATAQQELNDAKTELTNAKSDLASANTNLSSAKSDLATANAAEVKAQADYDAEVAKLASSAKEKYAEIELVGDLTVDASLKDFNGIIHGNGHIINPAEGTNAIFTTYTGSIYEAALNARLANSTQVTYGTVYAISGNSGLVYGASGNVTEYRDLGKFGFDIRDSYGFDLINKKIVALPANDNDKLNVQVFDVTFYNGPEAINIKQHYANLKDGKFVNASNPTGITLNTNMFAKSATDDIEGLGLVNVFYGNNNDCDKVEVVDGNSFYCPANIHAKEVSYNREFKAGYNSVCLPFELSYDDLPAEVRADARLCEYEEEDETTFWFKKVGDKMNANTPMLLSVTKAFTLELTGEVDFAQTPAKQIVTDKSENDESMAVGVFKKDATRDDINGAIAASNNKIYGMVRTEKEDGTPSFKFQAAGASATFSAFRMALYSHNAQPAASNVARRIGILDEKGIEITDTTTGIQDATIDGLSVAGGQGTITITSDADHGTVTIYSIDGRAAAVTEVIAGTTTVNLQKGLYIVLGQKVMVK